MKNKHIHVHQKLKSPICKLLFHLKEVIQVIIVHVRGELKITIRYSLFYDYFY